MSTHSLFYNLEEELLTLMKREIHTMREILSTVKLEQKIILENQSEKLKSILTERENLLRILMKQRSLRTDTVLKLAHYKGIKDPGSNIDSFLQMSSLIDFSSENGCSIENLKDQMLALNKEMRTQIEQNNCVLESKISFTKELIRNLHPSEANPTYSSDGAVKPQRKKTTLTLINREV